MSKINYTERRDEELKELRDNLKRNAGVTLPCLYRRDENCNPSCKTFYDCWRNRE